MTSSAVINDAVYRWFLLAAGFPLKMFPLLIDPLLNALDVLISEVAEAALEFQIFPNRDALLHKLLLDRIPSIFNFVERKGSGTDCEP